MRAHTLTVAGADVVTGRDFLAYQPPTLAGTVYTDANADAVQDAGDGGRQSVAVELYAADGTTLLAGAVTDATGAYSFSAANWAAAHDDADGSGSPSGGESGLGGRTVSLDVGADDPRRHDHDRDRRQLHVPAG